MKDNKEITTSGLKRTDKMTRTFELAREAFIRSKKLKKLFDALDIDSNTIISLIDSNIDKSTLHRYLSANICPRKTFLTLLSSCIFKKYGIFLNTKEILLNLQNNEEEEENFHVSIFDKSNLNQIIEFNLNHQEDINKLREMMKINIKKDFVFSKNVEITSLSKSLDFTSFMSCVLSKFKNIFSVIVKGSILEKNFSLKSGSILFCEKINFEQLKNGDLCVVSINHKEYIPGEVLMSSTENDCFYLVNGNGITKVFFNNNYNRMDQVLTTNIEEFKEKIKNISQLRNSSPSNKDIVLLGKAISVIFN